MPLSPPTLCPAAVKALHRKVRGALRDAAPVPDAPPAQDPAAWTAYPGALLPPAPAEFRDAVRSIVVASPGCGEIVAAWVFLHSARARISAIQVSILIRIRCCHPKAG